MDAAKKAKLEETTRWDPGEVEQRVFERWMEGGWFHPPAEGSPEENFSIAIPPPNVTGALHMGHALNGTIQDALIRINRMRGRNTIWILGTDHAGIATQAVVEKELADEGSSRHELGREEFDGARLGMEGAVRLDDRRAVQAPRRLLRLRARALHARRGLRPGRLPRLRRALREGLDLPRQLHGQLGPGHAVGDLRPRDREPRGRPTRCTRSPIRSKDGDGELVVATVRPETMLADTAVAVNPERRPLQGRGRQGRRAAAGRAASCR